MKKIKVRLIVGAPSESKDVDGLAWNRRVWLLVDDEDRADGTVTVDRHGGVGDTLDAWVSPALVEGLLGLGWPGGRRPAGGAVRNAARRTISRLATLAAVKS